MNLFEKQVNATVTLNHISIRGTDIKQPFDLIADGNLLSPIRMKSGWVSFGAYMQAKVLFDRHKEPLLKYDYIIISGHSLGGGVGQILALLLIEAGFKGNFSFELKGSIKVLGRKARKLLDKRTLSITYNVNHRDIVPVLGWWLAPKNKTPKGGAKKKHPFDYSLKSHMNYWS